MIPTAEDLWLAERRRCITATDIPRILGCYFDGDDGPRGVYEEKTSLSPKKSQADLRMRKGLAMQPFIAEVFQEKTGILLDKPDGFGLIRHPVNTWQAASLDMLTRDRKSVV